VLGGVLQAPCRSAVQVEGAGGASSIGGSDLGGVRICARELQGLKPFSSCRPYVAPKGATHKHCATLAGGSGGGVFGRAGSIAKDDPRGVCKLPLMSGVERC
jgi:hypothetical protein